jgi:L-threonylcarbamoyladenylate synthase
MSERISQDSLLNGRGAGARIESIARRIEAGEIFVYPTETIYGIGGRADNDDVKQKILRAKKRKLDHPMILLAGDKKAFIDFGVCFPPIAQNLAQYFWPGHLTLVLPFGNAKETIGVRVSNYPFIFALYKTLKVPIFSTSANISGQPYVNDPEHIFTIFKGKVDFMIDAGILQPSLSSTVVKILTDNKIGLVREGAIPKEKIMSSIIDSVSEKL